MHLQDLEAPLAVGRLHDDAALASFRRAVSTLQSVRQDIPVDYRDGKSSFQGTFGPLYAEFADLLLRRARRDPGHAGPLIREARVVLEGQKEAELQDYFRDACVTNLQARQRGVETQIPDRVLCAGQDEGVAARETHVARADALGRRRVQAQVGV